MGEDVELRCKAEASPLLDMAYTWKLNGKYFLRLRQQKRSLILIAIVLVSAKLYIESKRNLFAAFIEMCSNF